METVINKAIEGGYKFSGHQTHIYVQLCDPSFWQALGKACEWGDENGIDDNDYFLGKINYPEIAEGKGFREIWEYNALRFHELNLNEGLKSAVAWLNNLIKN